MSRAKLGSLRKPILSTLRRNASRVPDGSVWRRRLHGVLLAAATIPAAGVQAHHSISAVYDSARQLTVEGRVIEFQFINPHPVLVIDASAPGAAPQTWRLEMDNRSELADIGITAQTFKPGERVVAMGSAGRKQAQALYLLRLDRPADGLRYEQIGYSPRIGRIEH
jgi:hypothetical protein